MLIIDIGNEELIPIRRVPARRPPGANGKQVHVDTVCINSGTTARERPARLDKELAAKPLRRTRQNTLGHASPRSELSPNGENSRTKVQNVVGHSTADCSFFDGRNQLFNLP